MKRKYKITKAEKIEALNELIKFVKGSHFGVGIWYDADGLCVALECLRVTDSINYKQFCFVNKLIKSHTKYKQHNYIWTVGSKFPRIKWLREQLELVEKRKV